MKRLLRPLLLLTLLAILSAVVAGVIPGLREIKGRYYYKECNNFQEHKCVDDIRE